MGIFNTSRPVIAGRFVTAGAFTPLGSGAYSYARVSKQGIMLTAGESYNETLYNDAPADTSAHLISAYTDGARALGLYIGNTTGQSVKMRFFIYNGVSAAIIYEETLTNGQYRVLAPGAAGVGASANYIAIPALAFPVFLLVGVSYQMLAGSASGNLTVTLGRMT